MRNYVFIIFIACLISCQNKHLQIAEYNEIIYYKLDTLTANKTEMNTILSGEAIQNISDTLIFSSFSEFDFIESVIDKSNYMKLKQTLASNENIQDNSKCLPIYRDFLILKQNSKTVGIFKICFECSQLNYLDAFYNEEILMTDENNSIVRKSLK